MSQSVSQKNWADCAKSNTGFSLLGPFLLKPRPSQVSLGSCNWQTSPKIQENERKLVKFLLFLSLPWLSFKVSQSVSQKNRQDRAKSNGGFSFPGPFLLKPRPSQVRLVSRQLGNAAKDPGKQAQVGKVPTFPKPPSPPFLGVTVSKSEKPARLRKTKWGIFFPWTVSSKTEAVTG